MPGLTPQRPAPRQRRSRAFSRARPAFTLIEVLFCVFIMSILAAITIPRYASSVSKYRAQSAATRLATDLSAAREKARMTSTAQVVQGVSGTTTYGVGDAASGRMTVVDLSLEPYKASIASMSLTGTGTKTVFDGFGVPTGDGDICLRSGIWKVTLTVAPVTGRVTIGKPAAVTKAEGSALDASAAAASGKTLGVGGASVSILP